jgi:hypothetical protein
MLQYQNFGRGTKVPAKQVMYTDPSIVQKYWESRSGPEPAIAPVAAPEAAHPAAPAAAPPAEPAAEQPPAAAAELPADLAAAAAISTFLPEPRSFEEAMASPDRIKSLAAMQEELMSLNSNHTWQYIKPPPGAKVIPVRSVFTYKRDSAGKIEQYQARLVAKGFTQREGVDFDEVFSPTSKLTTFRVLLSLVATHNLELHQLDIKTAFLNGNIDTDVYLQQPPGFEQPDRSLACHINKTLYGLRQAPRAWYQRLKQQLESMGATASGTHPGLYIIHRNGSTIYLLMWFVFEHLVAPNSAIHVQLLICISW